MDGTPIWLLFSLLALLLTISAFFSGTETGMMSLNRYRLKHLSKKHRSARRVNKLLKRTDRLIGVILIGNNLANNFAAIVAATIAIKLYGNGAEYFAGILLTIVMLIFAEVTPKTIAALYPERVAFPASWVLKPLLKALYPVVWTVNHFSNRLVRMMGFNPKSIRDDSLSKEELKTVVDESSGQEIPSEHQGMLINILELENVTVNDIMIPKNEVFGIDLEEDIETLANKIIDTEYTRVPIYLGDINNVQGVLHMKRVNRLLRKGSGAITKEAIKRFSREPYFVPESTPLHVQLLNFKKDKKRIALVVDEYGQVEGLVTLEDILEEIVGEFTTNQTSDIDDICPNKDGSFTVGSSTTIREINKATGWHLPTEGPRTMNGLVLDLLQEIPEGNVCFCTDNYRFETQSLSDLRVDIVRVWQLSPVVVEEDLDE